MRKATLCMMAFAFLAVTSCDKQKNDPTNVAPVQKVETQKSVLKNVLAPDVLTYSIDEASNYHSISYQSKTYNVVGIKNDNSTYSISVSGNNGKATGIVTVLNGKASRVSFNAQHLANTIFEGDNYQ